MPLDLADVLYLLLDESRDPVHYSLRYNEGYEYPAWTSHEMVLQLLACKLCMCCWRWRQCVMDERARMRGVVVPSGYGWYAPPIFLYAIARESQIRGLHFVHSFELDRYVAEIARCSLLEELQLGRCRVNTFSASLIARSCKNIKVLNADAIVTDGVLVALAVGCPLLAVVEFNEESKLTDDGWKPLLALKSMRYAGVCGTLSATTFETVSPAIEVLYFMSTQTTDAGLLAGLRHAAGSLHTLHLSGLSNVALEDELMLTDLMGRLESVRMVSFECDDDSDRRVPIPMLEAMCHLPKLQRLCLSRCTLTAGTEDCLSRMLSLQELNLWAAFDATDELVRSLAQLPSLHTLNLECTDITDASLVTLAMQFTSLRLLGLDKADGITADGVQMLVRMRPFLSIGEGQYVFDDEEMNAAVKDCPDPPPGLNLDFGWTNRMQAPGLDDLRAPTIEIDY